MNGPDRRSTHLRRGHVRQPPLTTAVALIAIIVFLTATVPVMTGRVSREDASRLVSIAIDAYDLGDGIGHVNRNDLYKRYADAGATSIALYEWTIGDALANGDVFLVGKDSLKAEAPFAFVSDEDFQGLSGDFNYIGWETSNDDWVTRRLLERLTALSVGGAGQDDDAVLVVGPVKRSDGVIAWAVDSVFLERLIDIPIGFHPDEVEEVVQAGLYVVPRIAPSDDAFPADITSRFSALDHAPVGPFLFVGDRRDEEYRLDHYVDYIKTNEGTIGTIEFTSQPGLDHLIQLNEFRAVRVHSITEPEMASPHMTTKLAVDRMVRAVRERSVRLLYVRLFSGEALGASEIDAGYHGDHDANRNIDYVTRLREELGQAGFQIGRTFPISSHGSNVFSLVVAAAAVGGMGGLVTLLFLRAWFVRKSAGVVKYGAFRSGVIGAVVGSFVFWSVWFAGYTIEVRQMFALVTNIIFPVVAVVTVFDKLGFVETGETFVARFIKAVSFFLFATAVTCVGAVFVVIFLDDPRFALKLEQFRGVKVAHVIPPVLLLMYGLTRSLREHVGPTRPRLFSGKRNDPGFQRKTFRVIVGLFFIISAIYYVLRTGNHSAPVLSLESDFRNYLERVFVIRPRTKELLIGHPALFVTLLMSVGAPPVWTRGQAYLLAVAVGTIGQLSIINTFAHAHSPLRVSMMRTGNGLAIGIAIGIMIAVVLYSTSSRDRT